MQAYYDQSSLALAAYADLSLGETSNQVNALERAGFSPIQAEEFADLYPTVSAQTKHPSGFSATVFENASGSLTLAIRGTDLSVGDVITDATIALGGAGYDQIVAMYNWWNKASSPRGSVVKQFTIGAYALNGGPQPPPGAVALGTYPLGGISRTYYLEPADNADGDDKFVGAALDVVGHSLGSHLALAFNALFQASTKQVYGFNVPGFLDTPKNRQFFSALGARNFPTELGGNVTAVLADEAQVGEQPRNATSGLHTLPGLVLNVAIEDQGLPLLNHRQGALVDSIAVLDLLSDLSPSFTLETYKQVLGKAAIGVATSLEGIVGALAELFGTSEDPIPMGDRNALYREIYKLKADDRYKAVRGKLEVVPIGQVSIAGKAMLQDAEGAANRYALYTLNPFIVTGDAALYDQHQDKIQLYESRETNPEGMTSEYITDRAAMLAWLSIARSKDNAVITRSDIAPANYFSDIQSGESIRVYNPLSESSFRRFVFGGAKTDVLRGNVLSDRLYGGAGTDFLEGRAQDDYLDGGIGSDIYSFNARTTLIGTDVNDGNDTIWDGDGKGRIRYTYSPSVGKAKTAVIAGATVKLSDTQWQSVDAKFSLTKSGSDLVISINGDAGGSLTLKEFRDGDFGIFLSGDRNLPLQPSTSRDIFGDRHVEQQSATLGVSSDGVLQGVPSDWQISAVSYIYDGSGNRTSADVKYYLIDDLGNLVGSGDEADRSDALRDSGGNDRIESGGGSDEITADRGGSDRIDSGSGDDQILAGAGNDWVLSGLGNDFVSAENGDDYINAGAGRDRVVAGSGKDLVESGSGGVRNEVLGGDIVDGGDGDDEIYGDQKISLKDAIDQGNQSDATNQKGDYLFGGMGDDWLIAGAGNDVLNGGAGLDVLVGGAGDDSIDGDVTIYTDDLDFGWSVTRQVVPFDAYIQDYLTVTEGETGPAGQDVDFGQSDVIYAGRGDDWVYGRGGDDYIDAGEGADRAAGGAGADIVLGGVGNDHVYGDKLAPAESDGDDYLDGGDGDDTLWGAGGNDVLIGGRDKDILIGGAGKDVYIFNKGDGVSDVVIDTPDGANDPNASVVILGDGFRREDITFRMGSLLVDLGPQDPADPGSEHDTIHFEGFDALDPLSTPVIGAIQFADGSVMSYADILAQGFDIDGTEESDDGHDEAHPVLSGTAVTDRIHGFGGDDFVLAWDGDDVVLAGEGADFVEAGAGHDRVDGGAGDDILVGADGNDTLVGGEGADLVFGGAGDDAIFVGENDTASDLEGTNALDLRSYTALTSANLEVSQYEAADGQTYLNFHVRDDLNPGVTPATGGVSVLRGHIGSFASITVNDGQGGALTFTHAELMGEYAGAGFVIDGTDAPETLLGTELADVFFGAAGEDILAAGAGDDKIDGGAGNDTLVGGAGSDTYLLAYGGGRDSVVEDAASGSGDVHTVQLDAGIASSQVSATRLGDDLEVRLKATSDAMVLKDFYLQPQAWQDGWQVRDSNGSLTALSDYVPVVPPPGEGWLEGEKAAFRGRREQVYAANRQGEGYAVVGGNAYQRTEQTFSYSARTSAGSTTTRQLVVNSLTSDAVNVLAETSFGSTPLGQTVGNFSIGLPVVRGAGGGRRAVSSGFGSAGAGSGESHEFVPVQAGQRGLNGTGVKLNPGDYAAPVYAPLLGNQTGIRNAGDVGYANSGAFDDPGKWLLIGYNIVRAGGGAGQSELVAATATYQNYDQRLTVVDVDGGASDNEIVANDASLVEGGAGNDQISLGAGYFLAGPDWQGAFGHSTLSQSGFTTLFGPHANALGGFADGGAGDDTIIGSDGQDVITGGDGADLLNGGKGSDRYLINVADAGIDALTDSGIEPQAYLDWYYWTRGVSNWRERAEHADNWRVEEDGAGRFYFNTEAEADAAAVQNDWFNKIFIPALTDAAPVLRRDDALYAELQTQGVLSRDVIEFGPGLTLADLAITVQVDGFSAQDHPERPWVNGGQVSIRWGDGGSGVDFKAAPLNFGHEGPDLLSGGWLPGADDGGASDGSWRGYRLGDGIEAVRFADGTVLDIDQLLANATVVPDEGNYVLRTDSGYQLIDRRYGAVELSAGIFADQVSVRRDGLDLIINAPGAQGRVQNWYDASADLPPTQLLFEFGAPIDAATLTAMGLQVYGTDADDRLVGLDDFSNPMFGFAGDDALIGGSGEDRLDGGVGSDLLQGGAGKDTYAFMQGDGIDKIHDVTSGPTDPDASVIIFGEGIWSFNVWVGLEAGALVLHYGEGDRIHFTAFNADEPYSTPVFERLEFTDSSMVTYDELIPTGFYMFGTESDDVITGSGLDDSIEGGDGNDTLSGRGGMDQVYGGAGDDTLQGGLGDFDYLSGDEGGDTYVYTVGDGADAIGEWDETEGEVDRLQLHGIAPSELRVTRDEASYYLVFNGGERLVIDSMARDSAAVIERIEFDDETVWSPDDVAARVELLPATELDDSLWGTSADDTLEGLGGEDSLFGHGGNDLLVGGEGSDWYYFAAGDGADVIDNFDSDAYGDAIYFADAPSTDVTLVRSGNDLVFQTGTGGDQVRVVSWYLDANYKIDYVNFGADGGFWDSGTLEELAPVTDSNSAPELAAPIVDQVSTEEASFTYTVSADTFADADGEALTYSASLADGSQLPAWLTFDAATRTFSGTPGQADVSDLEVRVSAADAAGAEASDVFVISVANVNDAPVGAATDGMLLRGDSADLASLFAMTDEDGDEIQQYEFWDATPGNGHFTVNGMEQAANTAIAVAGADLASTQFVAGSDPGTDQVYVRGFDGVAWSAWKSWNMNTVLRFDNAAPEITASSTQTILLGQAVDVSTLFSVSDADGDAAVRYEFYDSTSGNGHFRVNGAEQAENTAIAVSVDELANTQFAGAASASADVVFVRATDGQTWSSWKSWTMNSWPHVVNAAPLVSASDRQVVVSNELSASSLFSVSDADGDAAVRYEFWDDTNGGGYLRLNGVQQAAGQAISVAAEDVADMVYVGGAQPGVERLYVRANDGMQWGDWKSMALSTVLHIPNVAPTATATNGTLLFNQSVQAASFFSVTDPDQDSIAQYQFWDATTAGGHFAVGNVAQSANTAITVSGGDLANIQFVAAGSNATDQLYVRAMDGELWSDWKSWNVTSAPHLTNVAPLASASNRLVLTNESVATAELFSVGDGDNDPIVQYEFWDSTAGIGHFSVNGMAQVENTTIAVSAADLAHTQFIGGATPGTDTVYVRASDGQDWGAWKGWDVTTGLHYDNTAPQISAPSSQTALLNHAVEVSSLFTATDTDGDAIARYEFWDATAGNGHFAVNGVAQGANVAIGVTAADLANAQFVAGSSNGSDALWVRATDGQTWSDWKSWTMVSAAHLTNAAPIVSAQTKGLLRNEVVEASTLFSVADGDGDAITQYEFWDDVNGGGHLQVNSVQKAASQSIAVNAADLAHTQYVGGANPGTEQVWARAYDGLAWGAWKNWLMSTEGGMVRGGNGPDTLYGSADTPVMEGGAGEDSLHAGPPNSLLSGNGGDDTLVGGVGNDLLAGGAGNDSIDTGAGDNLVSFNLGDGVDTVSSAAGASNSLSLGGGLTYDDLSLEKQGNDLILSAGENDKLVLKDWYNGADTVAQLQLILDATDQYDASSQDPLYNRRVQSFDFQALVHEFDQARTQSPGLTSWALTNALIDFHLSGSDDAGLGGDLAYYYGKNRGFNGLSLNAAQDTLAAAGFGTDAQTLHAFAGLQEGLVKLS
jgi:Ca2+-binding RTX toxin-like protein